MNEQSKTTSFLNKSLKIKQVPKQIERVWGWEPGVGGRTQKKQSAESRIKFPNAIITVLRELER